MTLLLFPEGASRKWLMPERKSLKPWAQRRLQSGPMLLWELAGESVNTLTPTGPLKWPASSSRSDSEWMMKWNVLYFLSGFRGVNCEVNVDDCPGHKCMNGGTCVDGVNTYNCQCPPEWTGTRSFMKTTQSMQVCKRQVHFDWNSYNNKKHIDL